MDLTDYRLLAQVSSGKDAIAYSAEAVSGGAAVEIRVIQDSTRPADFLRQLRKRLRLVQRIEHACVQAVHEVRLDHSPPFLVLEQLSGPTMASAFRAATPLAKPEAYEIAYQLALAVAAAHRLGVSHGKLSPCTVRGSEGRNWKVDFTGIDCSTPDDPGLHARCLAPESEASTVSGPAQDVFGLGAVIAWLIGKYTIAQAASKQAVTQESTADTTPSPAESDSAADCLESLMAAMTAVSPADRPSIHEVVNALGQWTCRAAATGEYSIAPAPRAAPQTIAGVGNAGTIVSFDEVMARERLGRFRLVRKLGQGGMGAVYRAEDESDGTPVAIKVLRVDWAQRPNALRRFHKEARLLAEVNNPYVANLLEVNEDAGIHFLALEFVEGQSLGKLLEVKGRLTERQGLRIMADVARALVDAHERGIVHRDIKPDNILLASKSLSEKGSDPLPSPVHLHQTEPKTQDSVGGLTPFRTESKPVIPEDRPEQHGLTDPGGEPVSGPSDSDDFRVKLADFGLARHVVETESLNMTQAGAILGTPLYMSPEQCSGGGAIGPPADVYSMGATLFHLLAGRPPFVSDKQLSIIHMHCNEPPPALRSLNPSISEATCRVVEKCLAKSAESRYQAASGLLEDIERVLRGEPASIAVHPRLPPCDASRVLVYDWTWQLESTPEQLWPHVSNTERLNRAVGLPAVQFTAEHEFGKGVKRTGRFRKVGMAIAWQEHPFEWIEARRMGVLREYSSGPFKWMTSIVELTPRAGGGTLLAHRVRIEPAGLVGRTVAAVEVGVKGRRAVERVYRRIDAALTGKLGSTGLADPFEPPVSLSGRQRARLDNFLDKLNIAGVEPGVVERFGDFLAAAPPQDVARIRPMALARRLGLDAEQLVAACLHGAREGMLVLLWDILCPICRIPSEVKETLRALREHGSCQACNLDFEMDFSNSVEMIFRVHPQLRETELGTYCIGGPVHSPHVAAQVRVGPGERFDLALALSEGDYCFRGPQLPFTVDFRVAPRAPAHRWEINLARSPGPELPRVLSPGRQNFILTNDYTHELVARIERTAPRSDALTAARASAMALFRELFPTEVLSPGQLVSVANIVLLVTRLDRSESLYREMGDARVFSLLHEHFRLLDECIKREGGALIKSVGEGVVAVFHQPVDAVRAALRIQELTQKPETSRNLEVGVAIHRGPALAATLNDHLDYFGRTVNIAMELANSAAPLEVILTQELLMDSAAASLLKSQELSSSVATLDLTAQSNLIVTRVIAHV